MGGYKKKEKGRDCDIICRKDEKGAWRSSGGTKENTRGDEAICGQK